MAKNVKKSKELAGAESTNEVKNITQEPIAPDSAPVEFPPVEGAVATNAIPIHETISVDKAGFYKLFKTCVHGYGAQLNKNAAVVKFGAVLGATNPVEAKIEWDKCQRYLETHK